jgi:hypothetical protein
MEGINRAPVRDEESGISPEKQELLALEAEGKYLFHGSDLDLGVLDPRQANDEKTGPDGRPAVFASNKVDMAIFSAIMRGSNVLGGSSNSRFGTNSITHDDGTITHALDFGMHHHTAKSLKESATGWVYVFDRNKFIPHPGKEQEFVSYASVTPFCRIKVAKRDLPEGIEIFD